MVGLLAAAPDYSHQRRLGIEFMNGEAVSFYYFNHDGTEENFDLKGVEHSGNTITGNFPHDDCAWAPQGPPDDRLQRRDGREYQANVLCEESL